jgi:hypothetical protein
LLNVNRFVRSGIDVARCSTAPMNFSAMRNITPERLMAALAAPEASPFQMGCLLHLAKCREEW